MGRPLYGSIYGLIAKRHEIEKLWEATVAQAAERDDNDSESEQETFEMPSYNYDTELLLRHSAIAIRVSYCCRQGLV